MSREIKFRAWDKQRNRMVEVFNIRMDGYGLAEPQIPLGINNGFYADYERAFLMQYTGLKDKNGVEIYEGDIVRWIWRNGTRGPATQVRFGTLKEHEDEGERTGWITMDCFVDSKCEIIGNIYENPEKIPNF